MNARKALFIATVTTIVAAISVLVIANILDTSVWRDATCLPNCFNETVKPGNIKQPIAAFSSLAYLFVGVFALLYPKTRRTKTVGFSDIIIRQFFGWSLVISGLGSAFLHMTLSFVGQTVDVVGMYLLATFVVLFAFRRLWQTRKSFLVPYVALNLVLLAVLIFTPDLRRYLFALLLIVGLIIEYAKNHKDTSPKFLIAAALTMAIGFIIWIIDQNQLLPAFYGHTLWHLFGAAAGFLLYRYYLKPRKD